jgi:acetolactate synthase-1/2/3 large subunit
MLITKQAQHPLSLYQKESPEGPIQPQAFIEKLSDLTATLKSATIITTGVG